MNKRELKRRHLLYYLDIIDKETGKTIGKLGDITEKGLLILSEANQEVNKILDIKIKLPDNDLFDGEYISLQILTLWSEPDKNPDIIGTGCKIISISDDELFKIKKLITYLGFDD